MMICRGISFGSALFDKVSIVQAPRLRSTQLSMKFQLLIKTKIPSNKEVSCFESFRCCIYHAYVKMPTIVGILTFTSRINFVLS